jgi:hypothetical protein
MSSSWSFKTTNESGTTETHDSSDVTILGVDTLTSGEHRATVRYTETDGLGTETTKSVVVTYSVEKDDNLVQVSYAVNFSNKELAASITEDQDYGTNGTLTFKATSSGKLAIDANNCKYTETDGSTRSFTQRIKLGGKTTSDARYLELKVSGLTKITIYARSSGSDDRRLKITANTKDSDGLEVVAGTATFGSALTKYELILNKADTYKLTADDGALNFYYIQIDSLLDKTSNPEATEKLIGGDTSYTLEVTGGNKYIAKGTYTASELAAALNLTYAVRSVNSETFLATELPEGDINANGFTVSIDKSSEYAQSAKVTVKYKADDNATELSATYNVAITMGGETYADVYDITASKETTSYEVDTSDDKATVKLDDIVVKPVCVTNTTPSAIANYTIKLKGSDDVLSGDQQLAVGTYTLVVSATLTDDKDSSITATFTKEITVTVKAKAAAGTTVTESFLIANEETAEAVTAKGTIESNSTVEDNSLFTLKNLEKLAYGYGGSITAMQTENKEISYTDMSGTVHNPNNALKTNSDVNAGSSLDVYTVTAKENITLYLYVSFINNSYNSARSSEVYYKIDNGDTIEKGTTARSEIKTIEVSLEKGQTLTLSVTNKETDSSKTGRLWLFGAEAKQV